MGATAAHVRVAFLLLPALALSAAAIDFDRARKFWSFQPIKDHPAPAVRNSKWVESSIDAFLLEKLESRGLAPAPPADRRTLIRRVTFDLTGLPPTPGEVAAFLADSSPKAFETVVERLLASPHYGERWGRHWLDLVRYAETDGHEFDVDKPNAWRYRDYVIRAFNNDVPYNRFVIEQLAGDLLPKDRVTGDIEEPTIATGFYWLGEVINTPVDTFQAIADRTDNQVDVIGKSLLGLTVACARCHDHKFDPIPTSDYYALAGFLESSRLRQAAVDSPARAVEIRGALAHLEGHPRAAGAPPVKDPSYEVFEGFDGVDFSTWTSTGLAFGSGPVSGIADSGRYSNNGQGILISKQFQIKKRYIHVRMAGGATVKLIADEYTNAGRILTGGDQFAWKTIDARMGVGNVGYLAIEDLDREQSVAVDQICFSDQKAPPPDRGENGIAPPPVPGATAPPSTFAMAATESLPKDAPIHIRGNHKTHGPAVPRRFLTVIGGENQPPISTGSGRLELARRITDTSNPLLARVIVNRVWKHHFGRGIVETVDNFGLTGEPPSHRELLDHLAYQFMAGGWSIKKLHRRMLLSSAYRMSSRPGGAADAADPLNKLLHRMPIRRLEAEAIRDSLLAVAGDLDRTLYGPSVPPYVSAFMDGRGKPKSGPIDGAGRRSIYIQVRRNYLTDMFLTFDYPLPITTIGRRGASTVPSQALWMMNSELIALQAERWACRVLDAVPAPEARVARLYEEAFGRSVLPEETREILAMASSLTARYGGEARAWADVCQVLMNTTEFIFIR